jgi:hypothetical protein
MGRDTRTDGRLTVALNVTLTLTSVWKVLGTESRRFPFLDSVQSMQRRCSWECAWPIRVSWTWCDLVQWAWSSFYGLKKNTMFWTCCETTTRSLDPLPTSKHPFTVWKKYVDDIQKFYVSFYFRIVFVLIYACMQNDKHWRTFLLFSVASLKPLF